MKFEKDPGMLIIREFIQGIKSEGHSEIPSEYINVLLDRGVGSPSTLAEIFRHTCLQSRLQTSPPTLQNSSEVSELYDKPFLDIFEISLLSGQNRVNWGGKGGPRNLFLIGIFHFVLLGSPCKNL